MVDLHLSKTGASGFSVVKPYQHIAINRSHANRERLRLVPVRCCVRTGDRLLAVEQLTDVRDLTGLLR